MKGYHLVPAIIFFMACKKNAFEGSRNTTNTDSSRLLKIIELDTTKTAPRDTAVIISFQYNANGSVSAITEITNPYLPAGTVKPSYKEFKFFYNGTDTIPYKRTCRISGGNTPPGIWESYDTCWYKYNAMGKKIADSTVAWQYKDGTANAGYGFISKNKYLYYTDSVIQIYNTGSTDNYTVIPDTLIDKGLLNSQGQIIKVISYPVMYSSLAHDHITSTQYNYTTVANPISRLNIFSTLDLIPQRGGSLTYFGNMYFQAQSRIVDKVTTNYISRPADVETFGLTTSSSNILTDLTPRFIPNSVQSNFLYYKVKFVYSQ